MLSVGILKYPPVKVAKKIKKWQLGSSATRQSVADKQASEKNLGGATLQLVVVGVKLRITKFCRAVDSVRK